MFFEKKSYLILFLIMKKNRENIITKMISLILRQYQKFFLVFQVLPYVFFIVFFKYLPLITLISVIDLELISLAIDSVNNLTSGPSGICLNVIYLTFHL